ncbi:MAG: helix-turn-helix transcriptional regulator [Firmicutes bacterium]|nr:helix-turn-helix transcriptional regulator [Bacillota bacterium]
MKEQGCPVEKMIAYIEYNLHEVITAQDLARAAGYSQYHAARLFKEKMDLSPFEYIRQERLLRSAHALRKGSFRVLDVALDYVFDSHEGFTRAFTKAFGISPKKYAKYPDPLGWLIPYRYLNRSKLKTEELKMEKTYVIFTQIIHRPARKLILLRAKGADNYFDYVAEVGSGKGEDSAAWDVLSELKDALGEPAGLWLPDNMRPEGTGLYAHGVEVAADYAGPIPEGYDVIDLELCKFIVFQGEPYKDENYREAVGICMDRIKKFNPEVYGYEYAPALAPRMQLKPEGWRGYIELLPVVEI